MAQLVSFANTKNWRDMSRQDRALALHIIEQQLSKVLGAMAVDITGELFKCGFPGHLEITYKLLIDKAQDPRLDG